MVGMKMGSRGTYGILALEELVRLWHAKTPVQVKEIAQRKMIPEEFLGQIMISLKQADIVRASRGPGGGYFLTRAPEDIRLGDVLRVLNGSASYPEENLKKYAGDSVAARRLLATWEKALDAMERTFNEMTLADLCQPDSRPNMYYI